MIRRQIDRCEEGHVDLCFLSARRAFGCLCVPLTTVFVTEKFELPGVVEKLSDPARESRVAAAISLSAGELVLEITFPDGGNAESVGKT